MSDATILSVRDSFRARHARAFQGQAEEPAPVGAAPHAESRGRRELRSEGGRDARHRRRIGLRKVDAVARDPEPDSGDGRRHRVDGRAAFGRIDT